MLALSCQLQIPGNILMDGTALLTGCNKAVYQRNRTVYLSGRKRLYSLYMMLIGSCTLYQSSYLCGIHALKYRSLLCLKDSSDLLQSLIASGL